MIKQAFVDKCVTDWQKCLIQSSEKTSNELISLLDKNYTQGVRHCSRCQFLRKMIGRGDKHREWIVY